MNAFLKTFGEGERVSVDGWPGTIIDSPLVHVYRVRLDGGGQIVERMGSTLAQLEESTVHSPLSTVNGARPVMAAVEHNRYPKGRWP